MVAGAAGTFFQPAAKGLVVQLVPAGPMLEQANALLQTGFNAVAIAGPGLADLVIATISPSVILAWDAVTFLVSVVVFATLPPAACRPAGATPVPNPPGRRVDGLRRAPLAVGADRL
ncbi:hypothetical protein [Nonomuraea sp. 10N515B]|uniref:hypothetical protein n=1 Tax=Nonomuraea sp. 10N515B TaxID=3457422 RepID=UPI003FCE2452